MLGLYKEKEKAQLLTIYLSFNFKRDIACSIDNKTILQ